MKIYHEEMSKFSGKFLRYHKLMADYEVALYPLRKTRKSNNIIKIERRALTRARFPVLGGEVRVKEFLEIVRTVLLTDIKTEGYQLFLTKNRKKVPGHTKLKTLKIPPRIKKVVVEDEATRKAAFDAYLQMLENSGVPDMSILNAGKLWAELDVVFGSKLNSTFIAYAAKCEQPPQSSAV